VTDFSVTSLNNSRYIFVLGANGMVRKGIASSLTPQWSQQVATTLVSGHTIFATPNGLVVAGGDSNDNRVAASGDGGSTFSVSSPLPVAGAVHVIADYRMGIIYAATDNPGSDIYNVVPGAGSWNFMGAPSTGFRALAQMGTLYGVSSTAGGTVVDRTLSPELLGPPAIEWDILDAGLPGGVVFTREPVGLKLSSGVNLWAIDNRPYNIALNTGRLWTFCDCLSPSPQYAPPSAPSSTPSAPSAPAAPAIPPKEVLFAAPVPYAPQPDDLIPIFINDNSVGEITFKWKPKTTAIAYELWLAADADFSRVILKKVITVENRRAPAWTIVDKTGIEPGNTYYWKVRIVQAATGEKGTGEWSEIFPFSVAANTVKKPVAQPVVIIPADNKTAGPAGGNKGQPASNMPEIFKELWFWQAAAVLFILLAATLVGVLLYKRQRRL
jgi:hypothetical protein